MERCATRSFLLTERPTRAGNSPNVNRAARRLRYPVIVYSGYERTQLTALAMEFPDLSVALNRVIARLADLLPIVRSAVYFPDFQFSNSIKSVAPALCPSFGYDDLDGIADGLAASAAFHQIASGAIMVPDELANLRVQLLAYCERDTLAMVEAHRALDAIDVSRPRLGRRPRRFIALIVKVGLDHRLVRRKCEPRSRI